MCNLHGRHFSQKLAHLFWMEIRSLHSTSSYCFSSFIRPEGYHLPAHQHGASSPPATCVLGGSPRCWGQELWGGCLARTSMHSTLKLPSHPHKRNLFLSSGGCHFNYCPVTIITTTTTHGGRLVIPDRSRGPTDRLNGLSFIIIWIIVCREKSAETSPGSGTF